jgi:hypothetical protein
MRTLIACQLVALAFACITFGCGSPSPRGPIDAPQNHGDGAVTHTDAPMTTHMDAPVSTPHGIICGAATCALPAQQCCAFPTGTGASYCYAVQGGFCEGGAPLGCDGPEDCVAGQACCYNPAGPGQSSCAAASTCTGTGGEIMCHLGDNSTCGTNGVCCPLHASQYGICRVGHCPV